MYYFLKKRQDVENEYRMASNVRWRVRNRGMERLAVLK